MEKLVQFLQKSVNGRNLHTKELVYTLENGTLQGVYADQISFCNLKYSQTGLQWDMFLVTNEKLYRLGAGGEREGLHKDASAVSLFRYELARRHSTGEVTGLFRFISASGSEGTAEAIVSGIFDIQLAHGTLQLREEQALYRDQFSTGGYKPVAFSALHRFFVVDGKLHYEYDGKSLDINTATMARKASGDTFPPFCSAER